MTPEQKEHFRWTFAGQAMAAILFEKGYDGYYGKVGPANLATQSRERAEALIAELERTAPALECYQHEWCKYTTGPNDEHSTIACAICGVKK